jgi:hypothetical protein
VNDWVLPAGTLNANCLLSAAIGLVTTVEVTFDQLVGWPVQTEIARTR